MEKADWPITARKHSGEESAFLAKNLLRESRRQKGLPDLPVPDVCVLDPDGDLLAHVQARQRTTRHPG